MLSNFFKIALRNIVRYKSFSAINIIGLALGLTACILIGLFVWDESQYDRSVPGNDRIYRLYTEFSNNSGTQKLAVTPPTFATVLKKDFPEVEQTARLIMQAGHKTLFEAGRIRLDEENGFFADSTLFDVLPLPFKYGSAISALNDAHSIVISQEMAKQFFGETDPVGRQLSMDKTPYLIRGVFEKDPKFHLPFDYIVPLSALQLPTARLQNWSWHQFMTYARLKTGTDVHLLQRKFQDEVARIAKSSPDEAQTTDKPFFQPLKDIHLYSADLKFDVAQRGNIAYVKALTIISIFILLIACFNFVNLATARSLQRAREVGVRKAIGAGRKQLIFQFVGETMLLAFISTFTAVVLASLLLPWLNEFTGKHIPEGLLTEPAALLLLLALVLATGLFAGFYPALVLSGFKPINVLKGAAPINQQSGRAGWLRQALVIIQFALSVLLIISSIVVFRQVDYLHHKDLGFEKDQIMFFPMRGDNMFKNREAFKNELLQSPGVASVSIGYGFPGDAVAGDEIITDDDGRKTTLSATQLAVDFDYVKTLGLQVVEGRDFSRAMPTDKDHAWIINETAVKELGFGTPKNAIGQTLSWHPWEASNPDSLKTGRIIGVVKDFNYKSLYEKVQTAVIQIFPGAAWKVAVKLRPGDAGNTIDRVKTIWNRFSPDYPIEYTFLDENFEVMYTAEDKLRSLLLIFTGIAIFVGCLGLFGLAAYAAECRKKEVGIRKVLGATTQSVVFLLSKEFIRLVVLSLLIASPVAWYFMTRWLEGFAYRITIGWAVFAVTAVVALGIAFITVSYQGIKAALASPVKSLRTE
ncbi:ABC transporter permease [Puia dinghuensis]|uniref:ABC transporter permease n=1 Tax=Puia dinghuensis TaxID=1792502 RepID=A0A8J2XW79_9BACT|nr:ABC transporter permease [Puia dinghuensis]GGB24294.1 ABC transporter permease [Puia dinghuensis]